MYEGRKRERALSAFFFLSLGWTFRIRNPTDDERPCESTEGRAGSSCLGGSDLRGMTSRLDRAVCHRVHAIVKVARKVICKQHDAAGFRHRNDVARGSIADFTARAA